MANSPRVLIVSAPELASMVAALADLLIRASTGQSAGNDAGPCVISAEHVLQALKRIGLHEYNMYVFKS